MKRRLFLFTLCLFFCIADVQAQKGLAKAAKALTTYEYKVIICKPTKIPLMMPGQLIVQVTRYNSTPIVSRIKDNYTTDIIYIRTNKILKKGDLISPSFTSNNIHIINEVVPIIWDDNKDNTAMLRFYVENTPSPLIGAIGDLALSVNNNPEPLLEEGIDIMVDDVVMKQGSKRGHPKEHLFKNDSTNGKWKEIFCSFLGNPSDYYLDTSNSKSNYATQVFASFLKRWKEMKEIVYVNGKQFVSGTACLRFLADDCKIKLGVDRRSYSSWIGKQLDRKGELKELIDPDIDRLVDKWFSDHGLNQPSD